MGRTLASLMPEEPEVHGLLALMELQHSRAKARTNGAGEPVLLPEQNRALWDQMMIRRGLEGLTRAQRLGGIAGPYSLQAAIAACHSLSPDAASTDWQRILRLYDHLLQLNSSPVIALNRAVALARVEGPEKAIAAVECILDRQPLDSYHLFHAVLGELESQRLQYEAAAAHLRTALQLAQIASERHLLSQRLNELEAQA